MGRAANRTVSSTSTAVRRGVDPRRLLSVSAPLVSGRDIHTEGESAAQRMNVTPPRTGAELLTAEERLTYSLPSLYASNPYTSAVNFIISGEVIYKASGAAYRGHLGFRTNQEGNRVICAFCTYGQVDGDHHAPVWEGDDLATAVKKLNSRLQSKLRDRKYVPSSGNPDAVKLSEQKFIDAFIARDPSFGGVPVPA